MDYTSLMDVVKPIQDIFCVRNEFLIVTNRRVSLKELLSAMLDK